jgi:hypothetical protein
MTNTGFPAVPAPEFADPLPGYSYVGEPCIAASYRIPDELERRVNGAVRYAGDTGKIPGVESQTDLIRVAGHCYVTQLEQQFNNGQTFPDPGANNHRGRGADHQTTTTASHFTTHGDTYQKDGYLPVNQLPARSAHMLGSEINVTTSRP